MRLGDLVRYKLEYDIDAVPAGIVVAIYDGKELFPGVGTMIGVLWDNGIWEDEARYFEVANESR